MIKVMIIDDEFYFREALKISLPWSELGFEICGEAKNGKDALEKVEELNPDIIIVDINMPIMDGLEFVDLIKQRGINSKIIFLTGHSEFNYAKKAVQLGVNNYILKPLSEEDLKNSLLEMKKLIEKELNIKIEVNKLKIQLNESLPVLKDKFLNDLIHGSLIQNYEEIRKKMKYLNINFIFPCFQVVTIELEFDSRNQQVNPEDKELWKFAVSNISNEIIENEFIYEIFYDKEDRICIILNLDSIDEPEMEPILENKIEFIKTTVLKLLDFNLSIGVGNVKNDIFEITSSYKESIVAVKNKITLGNNNIIHYNSIADTGINGKLFSTENRSQLLMNLRITNVDEIVCLINDIFQKIHNEALPHDNIVFICIEMLSVCLEFISEVGLNYRDVLTINNHNFIDEIQSKKTIEEMKNWIEDVFNQTINNVKKIKSMKTSKLIEEVKNYIVLNFKNSELNIDEIAKKLFVNYAHLCFIFKRDTGITINEYLTEFRINRAKELFDEGNYVILDVAEKVGYADANYFGKCFKKYYGLAPSKYIANLNIN